MYRKLFAAIILLAMIFISMNDIAAQKMRPIRYKDCLSGQSSDIRGNYDMLVSIFAVEGGETVIWSEGHQNVKVVNGCFEIPLGLKKKNLRSVLRSQNEFFVEVKLVRENLKFPRSSFSSSDIQKALSLDFLSSDEETPVTTTTAPNIPAMGRWICPLIKFGNDSKDFVTVNTVNLSNQTAEVVLTIYKSSGTEAASYSENLDSKSLKTWILDSNEFDSDFNGYAIISSDVTSIYPAGYYFYQEYYKHIYAPDDETLSYHWEDNAVLPLVWHRIE